MNLFQKDTSKFLCIVLIPLCILLVTQVYSQIFTLQSLVEKTTKISGDGIEEIVYQNLKNQSQHIRDKIRLKRENIYNELNIVAKSAQLLVDNTSLVNLSSLLQKNTYFTPELIHDKENNWSTTSQDNSNTSLSVWSYLHNTQGQVLPVAQSYIDLFSPLKNTLQIVGEHGLDKGWLYIVGPKKAPIAFVTPWADMPKLTKTHYPGFNKSNYWDFFFPNMIEGWQTWLTNPLNDKNIKKDEVTWTPLYKDAGGTGQMVTFFQPIWSRERDKIEGAIGLDYKLDNLIQLVSDDTISNKGFAFLLQKNGTLLGLSESNARILGINSSQMKKTEKGVTTANYQFKNSQLKSIKSLTSHIQKIDEFSVQQIETEDDRTYILSFDKIDTHNIWEPGKTDIQEDSLYIAFMIPEAEVFQLQADIKHAIEERFKHSSILSMSIYLSVFFLTFLLAAYIIHRATRQIRVLHDGVSAMQDNTLKAPVPILSQGELGELAHAFNNMSETVQTSYDRLKSYTLELEQEVKSRTLHLEEVNAELKRLSITDGLTGLYNRRRFDTYFKEVWFSYQRNSLPISIFMIDIDYFKQYNDHYGHSQGDECLIKIAHTLQSTLKRSSDFLARYGGEEFVIVSNNPSLGAANLGERLLNTIRELNIEHADSPFGRVSISLGATSLIPSNKCNVKNAIRWADHALYLSKEHGRNQFSAYNPLAI